jgi:hypothetical protein
MSLLSREAADELGPEPGMLTVAQDNGRPAKQQPGENTVPGRAGRQLRLDSQLTASPA